MPGQTSASGGSMRPARKTPAERAQEHLELQRRLKQEAAERRAAAAARAAERESGGAAA